MPLPVEEVEEETARRREKDLKGRVEKVPEGRIPKK